MSDCIAYVINIWVFYQEKVAMLFLARPCELWLCLLLWLCFVQAMQRRPYQTAYPFAWRRAVVIGGFFSAVFLLSAAMFMLIQGFQRVFLFADVHEVNSYLVTVLGITGLSFNALSVLLMCAGFEAHGHSHGNVYSAYPDALCFFGVVSFLFVCSNSFVWFSLHFLFGLWFAFC